MADRTLDNLEIPTGPIPPAPSVADVLAEFNRLRLPSPATDAPLDDETLEVLGRVEGYADPIHLAGNLTSALRVLWVARKSGELADEEADATLWLLGEVSSLLEHAIAADAEAVWRRQQHEKAQARAEAAANAKPATRSRRKRQEGAA